MKNVALIAALLFAGFGLAKALGADAAFAGRIGIAAVFAFTALGHFVKGDEMTAMLPGSVPGRSAIILLSGVLEAGLSILVLVPAYSRIAGAALGVFLVLVTPANIYAAIKRIDFGGHVAGPKYLLLRLPLQLLLLSWVYWFAVRSP
jgi:uncharacterized membrane protein